MIKFLVIRFSSIGDIVLTTPVVRLIKEQIIDSEVHYLTKQEYFGIVKNNPNIDKVHLLNSNNETELIEELKKEGFDHIIDLHKNLRTRKIKRKLQVPDFSFDKLNYKKWILVNFKKDNMPKVHIVDRYIDTLRVFDVTNDGNGLDYFLEEKDYYSIPNINIDEKFVAIVIGAKHSTKRLPDNQIIKLIKGLSFRVILLGGKEDIPSSEIITKSSSKNILNLCGKINLNQSASVIKQSSFVVSNDTGLMHIASAFKKDIVSVWGNTVPEFGMYPYKAGKNSSIFEVKGLKCRPCSKIGFNKCPKKHFKCMNDINIDSVSEYITKVLK